uniref:Orn/Lys/Arg family decarboxylase n=1 Tax=uncultured Bilophila sp. TaxID=529385 RepID=UPI0026013FD5|nr:Orn/Lys/Arg decarboxylase N-terminal domain-containing protein [uncultured Bilophila sp.]
MISNDLQKLGMKVLMAHRACKTDSAAGRVLRELGEQLVKDGIDLLAAANTFDATALIQSEPLIQALLLDWDLEDDEHHSAMRVLAALRNRNHSMPVFLFTDRENAAQIPLSVLRQTNDFIWLFEDTAGFIAGRILAAVRAYRGRMLPPMFSALAKFSQVHEYSWHTPGHTGGTAFMKSPAGRAFFDFFGENIFRSDLSISVGELGSLLDHSGPIGEGEKYAATVFGAHRTYCVTNGSSTSNRVILMASVTRDQVALCDRNCHKSIEHAITMSGAIPTYMLPSRNHYGLIGPIPPSRLTPEAVRQSVRKNKLVHEGIDPAPVHAIVTNSTYDGLCYNVKRVEELLGQSVDRLHFDEAWYGYARFNPLYMDRFAMHGAPEEHDERRPTVFATQSTHKLLAAFSQASMIHIREGRNPIEHNRFNEAFMMHASTSPNYAIIASNDISASMMDGAGGKALTDESIREAVAFRCLIARLNTEFAEQGQWFVNVWQPDVIREQNGTAVPFHRIDEKKLASDPAYWVLRPNAGWHGFGDIEDGFCMLDPIKVSVTTPGVGLDGGLQADGIPATILTAYLDQQGIVVEKTTDFTILFLFSIGITKGKWGTLVDALLKFKQAYDRNMPLTRVLPRLVAAHPERYGKMGLKELAQSMFAAMKTLRTTNLLSEAFSVLPEPELTPTRAYEELVKNNIERLTLDRMADRTVATGVVPYPPGIPLLMPGEKVGPADGPVLGYLKALEAFDVRFPGFEHDTHGVENENGRYVISCLKQ